MYKLILLCGFLHSAFLLRSQSVSTLMGARAQGVGYASSCLADEWSVFNNIGALGRVEKPAVAFTYLTHPGFKSFDRMAAVGVLPVKIGVAGLGVFKFGDDLYSEQLLTAGLSNTFGIASLGAKVNYIQYNAEGFGRKAVTSLSFGGVAKFSDHLSLGAHITNIFQPKLSEEERLPTRMAAGIMYSPGDKCLFTTEFEKEIDYSFTWKTGLEYRIIKKLALRTGFNVRPDAGFFGIGFTPTNFQIDYAYAFRPEAGPQHQATVMYRFKRKAS